MNNTACNPTPELSRLLPRHHEALVVGSGISEDVIAERGYRSVSQKEANRFGFTGQQCRSGLLIPVHTPDGGNTLFQLRPDSPRISRQNRPIKYETPRGVGIRVDCPARCRERLKNPAIPLWVTEGVKKSDALASHDLCCIDLLGVWNFKGKNDLGGVAFLADWDYIAFEGREVRIVYDSDVTTKPSVQQALQRLTEHFERKRANVTAVYLPGGANGEKVGVDDYLLNHSVADLEALAQAPPPVPKPVAPTIELLDEPPSTLTRPLQLIEGHAYATTWLWRKVTITEELDIKGQIITHNPPIVKTEKRQFVIRDDGVIFGEGKRPIEELGLQTNFSMTPKDSQLWSKSGVIDYEAGYRPDPLDIFDRLTTLFDHFMSFDRSLADQSTMCELVASYAMSTWFLDTFDTIGFMQSSGGLGSGKTKLGILVCEVAYLGEVLLASSTYPTLRDFAELGATLLFDDAETLSDPKKCDPDKRNLLLAGNRKGTYITVKEARADGKWDTKWVNAYCTRLLSAIRLPDPVLGSRIIVIPLVKSATAEKANAEPLDYSQWTCEKKKLMDDHWAMALAHQAEMPAHQAAVNADAPLIGRNLEPWRPTLAVAHFLDSLGKAGLYERMCKLAKNYQTERAELEMPNVTTLVVKALAKVVPSVPLVPLVHSVRWGVPIEFNVSDVTAKVNELAVEEELAAEGQEYATAQKIGKELNNLRVPHTTREAKGKRRKLTPEALNDICVSYGLPAPFKNDANEIALPPSNYAQTADYAQTAQAEERVEKTASQPVGDNNGHGDEELGTTVPVVLKDSEIKALLELGYDRQRISQMPADTARAVIRQGLRRHIDVDKEGQG